MEKQEKLLIQWEDKKLSGKIAKPSSQEPMTLLFQDTLLLIQLVLDFGNLYQSMNLILVLLTLGSMKKLLKQDRGHNTLQVFFIQMIQLIKENN